jgi:hypothetical protein
MVHVWQIRLSIGHRCQYVDMVMFSRYSTGMVYTFTIKGWTQDHYIKGHGLKLPVYITFIYTYDQVSTWTIDEFPEVFRGMKVCCTGDHLFKVWEDMEGNILPKELTRKCHHTAVQILFLCKWAKPEVGTAILFVSTRVKVLDADNWGKMIHYLILWVGRLNLLTIVYGGLTSPLGYVMDPGGKSVPWYWWDKEQSWTYRESTSWML